MLTLVPFGASRAQTSAGASPDPAATTLPAIAPDARVRVTTNEGATLPPGTAIDRAGVQAEGRFVRFDSASVVVRLRGGIPYTLPASSVKELEVRGGPGFCRESTGNRIACIGLGLVGGFAIGRAGGSGQTDAVGAVAGLSIGLVVALGVGQDRWTRIENWPPRR